LIFHRLIQKYKGGAVFETHCIPVMSPNSIVIIIMAVGLTFLITNRGQSSGVRSK